MIKVLVYVRVCTCERVFSSERRLWSFADHRASLEKKWKKSTLEAVNEHS